MKSFGVRLAAGAITILFGAYAAVLAQKDNQDSSKSWTAKAPLLGEPAMPIADIGEETWLSQPAASDSVAATNQVQLAQHTEPIADEPPRNDADAPAFDPSGLPSSLGGMDPAAVSDVDVPDWTLPAETESVNEPAASPGITMALPGAGAAADAEAAPSDQQPGQDLPTLTLGEAPAMDFYPAETGGPDEFQQETFQGEQAYPDDAHAQLAAGAGMSYAGADQAMDAQSSLGQPDSGQPQNATSRSRFVGQRVAWPVRRSQWCWSHRCWSHWCRPEWLCPVGNPRWISVRGTRTASERI